MLAKVPLSRYPSADLQGFGVICLPLMTFAFFGAASTFLGLLQSVLGCLLLCCRHFCPPFLPPLPSLIVCAHCAGNFPHRQSQVYQGHRTLQVIWIHFQVESILSVSVPLPTWCPSLHDCTFCLRISTEKNSAFVMNKVNIVAQIFCNLSCSTGKHKWIYIRYIMSAAASCNS